MREKARRGFREGFARGLLREKSSSLEFRGGRFQKVRSDFRVGAPAFMRGEADFQSAGKDVLYVAALAAACAQDDINVARHHASRPTRNPNVLRFFHNLGQ